MVIFFSAESFSTNPQFAVKLDIDSNKDRKCSVLVALMQKDYRQFKQKEIKNNSVGVEIYKVPQFMSTISKKTP